MMIKSKIIVCLICVLFSLFFVGCDKDCMFSEKEMLSNRVIKKAAMKIKKEKGLNPCGTSAQMADEIKMLGLSFFCYKHLEIGEARELLIYANQKFLEEINAEKSIHPYLCKYPFNPKRLEIHIFLCNSDGSSVPQGDLRVISLAEGFLEYEIHNPETNLLLTVYKETYEEALVKIAHSDTSVSSPSSLE